MKYLLPCSCGKSISLDIAQAGQNVTCGCGATQQAPTLLKMKSLPVAEEGPPTDSRTGTAFDAQFFFRFLGLIVLIPSVIFLIWALWTSPRPIDVLKKQTWLTYGRNTIWQDSTPIPPYERRILIMQPEYIDYMTPFEAFDYFRILKNGPMLSQNFQENYEMLKDAYRIRVSASLIGVGLGLLSLIASLFVPKQTKAVGVRKGAEWK